eukprot:360150-Pelagomonas_calceolata.AAC.2
MVKEPGCSKEVPTVCLSEFKNPSTGLNELKFYLTFKSRHVPERDRLGKWSGGFLSVSSGTEAKMMLPNFWQRYMSLYITFTLRGPGAYGPEAKLPSASLVDLSGSIPTIDQGQCEGVNSPTPHPERMCTENDLCTCVQNSHL